MRLPYKVYSSDSHVIEPADLWTRRMDEKWRAQAPRIQSLPDTDIWVVGESTRLSVVGIQEQAGVRYADPTQISKKSRLADSKLGDAGHVPELYLKGLDEDGVAGAVVYPSVAIQAFRCIEGPLLSAVTRTYNDWILEFCKHAPKRLRAAALIAVDEPALAIEEMRRVAKHGAAVLSLPVFPTFPKTYDREEYAQLWRVAEELGLPVVFHLGSNQHARVKEPPLDLVVHATKDLHVQRSLVTLILGGIFAKHPKLRVGAVEFGASWAVPLGERLDAEYDPEDAPYRLPEGEKPSDHLKRNVFYSFQDDVIAIEARDVLGVQNLQWGNDYPHAESTYPRSHEILKAQLEGVPEAEAARIAGGNAVAMYGFE